MKILTLNGWAQPHDGLKELTPESAVHFDYSQYPTVDEVFTALHEHKPDCVVGWSLGGQLAVRAVAEGILNPQYLVLLGTPFQYVADDNMTHAIAPIVYNAFTRGYEHNTQQIVDRFRTLVAAGDSNAANVKANLSMRTAGEVARWLPWLKEIGRFSCRTLDFSNFPATFIVHGEKDTVVPSKQARLFEKKIATATLEIWKGCSHAPHLHNTVQLKQRINEWSQS